MMPHRLAAWIAAFAYSAAGMAYSATPAITNCQIETDPAGGRIFSFGWSSQAGARYQVEGTDDPGKTWSNIGEMKTGDGALLFHSEPMERARGFFRVKELEPFPPIFRVATFGDSLTAESSHPVSSSGNNYWPGCWPAHLRTLLQHKLRFERNPINGRYTFGVSGTRSESFIPGGTMRAYWEAALSSDASAVMIMLGANDVADPGKNIPLVASNIVSMWDEALAAGKHVIGLEVLSCRSDHPSSAFYPQRQSELNTALISAAIVRDIEFIRCAKALDDDGDGFSDAKFMGDTIHTNIVGGMALADFIAPWIAKRVEANPTFHLPEPTNSRWVTINSYPSGTPGEGQKANGWTVLKYGNSVVHPRLISRIDGLPGCWQELDLSGTTDARLRRSVQLDYVQVYNPATLVNCSPGDKLVAVAEIEMSDPFWSVWVEMHCGGLKASDHYHNGNLAVVTVPPKAYRGLLVTEPWEYTAGSYGQAMITISGNGRLRIGRLGILKVE